MLSSWCQTASIAKTMRVPSVCVRTATFAHAGTADACPKVSVGRLQQIMLIL